MSEEEGFLTDILSNPDDDLPRLIYADYLEDRGDPGVIRELLYLDPFHINVFQGRSTSILVLTL